jgi:hypothetical protein
LEGGEFYVLLLYIVMKPHHLQYLLLVAGLLQIVQGFTGAIVSEMVGRGRGGVGGNTVCVIVGGIGENGLSFVDSVQQCRFGGRAVGMDGAKIYHRRKFITVEQITANFFCFCDISDEKKKPFSHAKIYHRRTNHRKFFLFL